MRDFSISNVALTGPHFMTMKELPSEIGVEIFYEWGGSRFYSYALKDIFADRKGSFSIHAPFQYIDFSADCDETALFDYLKEPFELYHEYNSVAYVLHTDSPQKKQLPADVADERRKRVEDRLFRFEEICRSNSISLLVENLCIGNAGFHLFDENQFMNLFTNNPRLNCLIDIGHANVQHLNLQMFQEVLGERIKAYHLHDNDGCWDSHQPIFTGTFDWENFAKNVYQYTPNAQMVLEYGTPDGIDGLCRDIKIFEKLLQEFHI